MLPKIILACLLFLIALGLASCSSQNDTGGVSTNLDQQDVDGWSVSKQVLPHFAPQPDASFRVHPTHPRLYFRREDLTWLRQRLNGSLPEIRAALARMVSAVITSDPGSPEVLENIRWSTGENAQAVALLAVLDGNASYANWAVRWARALANLPIPVGDDGLLCDVTQRIAVVYDWLHDTMPATDRTVLHTRLIELVEKIGDLNYIKSPMYVGGHERRGYAVYAMALLALHGEYPEAVAALAQCRQHILNGFYPTQSWIASDGGYHMGWAYTSTYTNFDLPYLVWTTGTNDVVLDDWMGEMAYWYIYGLQGDNTFPNGADAFGITGFGNENISYGAGVLKQGHAKWQLENKFEKGAYAFLQLLLAEPSVAATTPDDLPKARRFQQAGHVVARDAWDEGTTHFTFKSGAFQSTNHHHRDENTFTIHYKAPLAIDSGYYDWYGSPHWKNYFTRTVAHNGIVVYDPAQTYTLGEAIVSNDGGQVFRPDPRTLADIMPGGSHALDGLLRYENREAFCYARGDATKAYDPARVTLAQREIVYLRYPSHPHPVIVIFDRVGATSTAYEKRFLLHTVDQPAVNGKKMVAERQGGRLTSLTLLPTDATLSLVGGPGHDAWVDGQNYPYDPNAAEGPPAAKGIQPGAWRLEVSPGVKNIIDYFLHTLFVDDTTAGPLEATAAVLLSGDSYFGAQLAGWITVFPKATSTASRLSYTPALGGRYYHLVAGFAPRAGLNVLVDGAVIATVQAGEGGCVSFEATVAAGQQVTIE